MFKSINRHYTLVITTILLIVLLPISARPMSLGFQWIVFLMWVLALLILIWKLLDFKKNPLKDKYLWIVLFISIFVNLLFIDKYPFTFISDELRDTGADASSLFNSQVENIFGYGSYGSHGLIIPTLAVPFYAIFENTRFSIVLPAALFGIVDAVFIYLLTKKFFNKKVAFIAAICLALNPLHLYYARTQLVVMMSSLLTTINLYFLFNFITKKNWKSFLLTAVIFGFSFNFHHSIKPISVFLALMAIIYAIKLIKEKKLKLKFLLIWLVMFIVSFGPRLMFTDVHSLFGLSRLPVANGASFNTQGYFQNYLSSLKVIDLQPTRLFFAEHVSLLPLGSVVLMLVGLGLAVKEKIFKLQFIYILVFLILAIPFTNSAITDIIGSDHRLAPLLPLLSIVFSLACYAIWIKLKNLKEFNNILSGIFFVIISFAYLTGAFNFFSLGWANRSMHQSNLPERYRDFQIHYVIQEMQKQKFDSLCIYANYEDFPMFVLNYYFPQKEIIYTIKDIVPEGSMEVVKDCNPLPIKSHKITYCNKTDFLICPEDGKPFSVRYIE